MQEPFKAALKKLLDQYAGTDLEQVVNALDDAHDRLEDKLLRQIRAEHTSGDPA